MKNIKKCKIWFIFTISIFLLSLVAMIILTSINMAGINISSQALFQTSMVPVYMSGGLISSGYKYFKKSK